MTSFDQQESPLIPEIFKAQVLMVCLVAFDHTIGPMVEYVYPSAGPATDDYHSNQNLPVAWKNLAFFALPDGSHQSNGDFCYFHLPIPDTEEFKDVTQSAVFGISCIGSISSDVSF
jgi:hypothetical protein